MHIACSRSCNSERRSLHQWFWSMSLLTALPSEIKGKLLIENPFCASRRLQLSDKRVALVQRNWIKKSNLTLPSGCSSLRKRVRWRFHDKSVPTADSPPLHLLHMTQARTSFTPYSTRRYSFSFSFRLCLPDWARARGDYARQICKALVVYLPCAY